MFLDKTIMITGGTGSFGKAFIEKLLKRDQCGKIVVFSRDEKKQYDMRKYFNNSKIKFIIGDTRDRKICLFCLFLHCARLEKVF